MRSDRKSLRFFLPIPSFFSTFTVQKASFKPKRKMKTKKLMTEKEKEYRQLAAVPVRPDGNAPLAALRGGIDRQSAVAALQLRGYLQ